MKGNYIAVKGEVVSADKFINLQYSLDGGFCEETKDPIGLPEKGVKTLDVDFEEVIGGEDATAESIIKHIKTLNKGDLKAWAEENDFEVDEDLNKKNLLSSIIEQVEEYYEEEEE